MPNFKSNCCFFFLCGSKRQDCNRSQQPRNLRNQRVAPVEDPPVPNLDHKICTAIPLSAIESSDFRPVAKQDRARMRYTCPICSRFYSHMLECIHCLNYTCHTCAGLIIQRIRQNPAFDMCGYCAMPDAMYRDIDYNARVKVYSDTPLVSFASSMGRFGATGQKKTFHGSAFRVTG